MMGGGGWRSVMGGDMFEGTYFENAMAVFVSRLMSPLSCIFLVNSCAL